MVPAQAGLGVGWSKEKGPHTEQQLCSAQRELEMGWDAVLDGFGGITWLGRDLARGTAQARAAGTAQPAAPALELREICSQGCSAGAAAGAGELPGMP